MLQNFAKRASQCKWLGFAPTENSGQMLIYWREKALDVAGWPPAWRRGDAFSLCVPLSRKDERLRR